jgi:hypothetical protein
MVTSLPYRVVFLLSVGFTAVSYKRVEVFPYQGQVIFVPIFGKLAP